MPHKIDALSITICLTDPFRALGISNYHLKPHGNMEAEVLVYNTERPAEFDTKETTSERLIVHP